MQLTDEALAEWRSHPVTEHVRAAITNSMRLRKEEWKEAAWNGAQPSDEKRLVLKMVEEFFADLFDPETTPADIETMIELEPE